MKHWPHFQRRKGPDQSEAQYAAQILGGLLTGLTSDERLVLAAMKARAGNHGVRVISNQLQVSLAGKVDAERYTNAVKFLGDKGLLEGDERRQGWEFWLTEAGLARA